VFDPSSTLDNHKINTKSAPTYFKFLLPFSRSTFFYPGANKRLGKNQLIHTPGQMADGEVTYTASC